MFIKKHRVGNKIVTQIIQFTMNCLDIIDID